MNNKDRMAILANELKDQNMSKLAHILLEAMLQMPEWSMEHLGAYEFMDIMKYTLKNHLSRKAIETSVSWNGDIENQKDELFLISQQARRALDLIHVHDNRVLVKRALASNIRQPLLEDYKGYFSMKMVS